MCVDLHAYVKYFVSHPTSSPLANTCFHLMHLMQGIIRYNYQYNHIQIDNQINDESVCLLFEEL